VNTLANIAARAMTCRVLAVVMLAGIGAAACSVGWGTEYDLHEVVLPDITRLDPAVQQQVRDRYEALQHAIREQAPPERLGTAYGEFGMLLQAAEYLDAAQPAYENAQALQPVDPRWPYYLGHLHKTRGDLEAAGASFTRVLELQPDDLATLIWLGRLHLDLGQPEEAERLFGRAASIAPDVIAVLAGQGRAALAKKDTTAAIRHFERALALDPTAESLHAPLASAYRAAGMPEKAEPHLREWQNRDILVPDPLHQELDMLLESGLANELRGVRALDAGDFTSAAEYFRRGLALTAAGTPLRRSLGHKLGTALYAAGQEAAAVEQFRDVVRSSPAEGIDEASGKAHYSLGVIMLARGEMDEAIELLQGAVTYQPDYTEARTALAEALRRTGQLRASLPQYEAAIALNPQSAQARWGHALALVRLDRHRDARRALNEAMQVHPERPEFRLLLARLLAASPDAGVRDGARAMTLVQDLLRNQKTVETGETLAMALAETGDFDQARSVQHSVLQAVRRGGNEAEIRRLEAGLRSYERRQPLRSVFVGEVSPP
jgi:tetratricopeptide (TPR) repeat protein